MLCDILYCHLEGREPHNVRKISGVAIGGQGAMPPENYQINSESLKG